MRGQEGEAWLSRSPAPADGPGDIRELIGRLRADPTDISRADRSTVYRFLEGLADKLAELAKAARSSPPIDKSGIDKIKDGLAPVIAAVNTYLSDELNVFKLTYGVDDDTGLLDVQIDEFVDLFEETCLAIADFEEALESSPGAERKTARSAVVKRLRQCHAKLRAMLRHLEDWD